MRSARPSRAMRSSANARCSCDSVSPVTWQPVVARGDFHEAAPAAADLQDAVAGLRLQPREDGFVLRHLGGLEAARRVAVEQRRRVASSSGRARANRNRCRGRSARRCSGGEPLRVLALSRWRMRCSSPPQKPPYTARSSASRLAANSVSSAARSGVCQRRARYVSPRPMSPRRSASVNTSQSSTCMVADRRPSPSATVEPSGSMRCSRPCGMRANRLSSTRAAHGRARPAAVGRP